MSFVHHAKDETNRRNNNGIVAEKQCMIEGPGVGRRDESGSTVAEAESRSDPIKL